MHIAADVASLISSDRQVVIEHTENGATRRLTFPLSLYKRNNFSEDNETFRPINEYWDSLTQKKQSEIYAIFEDIRELFDSAIGNEELETELQALIAKLMSYHTTTDVQSWIRYKSNLKVPKDIRREYVYDVDTNTTPDKTYIYDDYVGLMALSVIFRAMVPIWAMFSKPAKAANGKTHKEKHAFMLLRDSEVYHSEPMERLKRYITANISKDTHTGNHTLEFIPSDDMPLILLSLVCVRKLFIGELYEENPRQKLAALVYTYVMDRPSPTGGDHSEQVRTKKLPKEGAGEVSENAGSMLELYKARANITVGRIAEIEYSLRDIPRLAQQLCPLADDKILYKDCMRALETSELMLTSGSGIQSAQLTLAQWVINPVVPAQGLLYLEEDLLVSVCALVETVLRHRDFKYLALFATAVSIADEKVLRVSPVGGKSQIGEDLAAALAVNFPFVREPKRKTPSNTRIDFVQDDIRRLSTDISQHTWRATADDALVRQVLGTHVRRIPIPTHLRSDIGMMLVKSEEEFN